MGYLIDSNAVIDYLGGRLPKSGIKKVEDSLAQSSISIVTKIEILSFNGDPQDELILKNFIKSIQIQELSNEIVDQTILLRKNLKIKIPDAIIAATAIVKNLILITRNIEDFKNVGGIRLLNPWKVV